MGSPVFYDVTYTTPGEKEPLPLNRWSRSNYSVVVDLITTGEYTVEGTLNRLNRDPEVPAVWFELSGLVGLTTDITEAIKESPLEAIRIDVMAVDSTLRFQVMQGGEG